MSSSQRVNVSLSDSLRLLSEMQEKLSRLENMLKAGVNGPRRPTQDTISDEVVDNNPYSRLMALQKMGIVDNYRDIRKFTIIIIGVGGVGSVAAEMLARCGIGKLILYDFDKVELANMNRLFFQPCHTGMTKVQAAEHMLKEINPDVVIEAYNADVTSLSEYPLLVNRIRTGGLSGCRVDLLFSCVDNYGARACINKACNETRQCWIESGVSESGVAGHVQLVVPGYTACFMCTPPLIVADNIDEKTLKRDGVCAASLPTTMAIVSALLVQTALKCLLNFGQVSLYLTYSAMGDFFDRGELKPNSECSDPNCRQAQRERAEFGKPLVLDFSKKKQTDGDQSVLHEDNKWGISVSSAGTEEPQEGKEETVSNEGSQDLASLQEKFRQQMGV